MSDENMMRFNQGKPRMELLGPAGITELARVYTFGAQKYADNDWRKGGPWTSCIGCALRHIFKWLGGEDFDQESGCHHLAHAAWNCLAIVEFTNDGVGTDDRHQK